MATGWGSTVSGGGSSLVHREVSMPVLTDARCEQRFDGSNNMLDPPTQICAGEEGGNKDTCQGDSGGPLVVKYTDGLWYVIGLTSWVSFFVSKINRYLFILSRVMAVVMAVFILVHLDFMIGLKAILAHFQLVFNKQLFFFHKTEKKMYTKIFLS